MRFSLFIALLPGLLVACHSAGHEKATAALPGGRLASLRGTWLLELEASRADTLTYRPNTYRFRYRPGGRPGFWLGSSGRFTRYEVAPGGGLLAQAGTWQETTAGRLLIHLPELLPAEPDYELEVLAFRPGVLQLRRRTTRPAVEILRQPQ